MSPVAKCGAFFVWTVAVGGGGKCAKPIVFGGWGVVWGHEREKGKFLIQEGGKKRRLKKGKQNRCLKRATTRTRPSNRQRLSKEKQVKGGILRKKTSL